MEKCKHPEGMSVNINGIPIDPCLYATQRVFTNCTVEISRCKNCGHIEINWYKTANTEEIPEEEWDNYLIPYHD